MRSDLGDLPETKRLELSYAVELVRAGFAQALSGRTQERYRRGEILKVVLLGSYAREEWWKTLSGATTRTSTSWWW